MGPCSDSGVPFCSESEVIQTEAQARAAVPQLGVPKKNKDSKNYLEADLDSCC